MIRREFIRRAGGGVLGLAIGARMSLGVAETIRPEYDEHLFQSFTHDLLVKIARGLQIPEEILLEGQTYRRSRHGGVLT